MALIDMHFCTDESPIKQLTSIYVVTSDWQSTNVIFMGDCKVDETRYDIAPSGAKDEVVSSMKIFKDKDSQLVVGAQFYNQQGDIIKAV